MEQQELTFGQKAVGLSFNPSCNDKVNKVKQLAADLIDLVELDYLEKTTPTTDDKGNQLGRASWTTNVFRTAAFNAIIAAQMAVVKFLTWRD